MLCYSTSVNPAGLTELCTTTSLLAFPGVDKGQVSLVNIAEDSQSQMRMIPAHTGPLAILSLNMQGTMLATASDKGTLIRIFDTHKVSDACDHHDQGKDIVFHYDTF